MDKYAKVEEHAHLRRDMTTGAIINTNSSELRKARERKLRMQAETTRINNIENDVKNLKSGMNEIKDLLKELLERG